MLPGPEHSVPHRGTATAAPQSQYQHLHLLAHASRAKAHTASSTGSYAGGPKSSIKAEKG